MSARRRAQPASAGDALLAHASSSVQWDASASAYSVRAVRTEDVQLVRELLQKERREAWQSTDNLYPSLILLVYVPQAVSCLPLLDSDANRRWCGCLLLVTVALNLFYLLVFFIASQLVYRTVDRKRDAAQLLAFWLEERRTNIGVRVRLLLAVVLLDLALTLCQLCLLYLDRAPLQQTTSPDGLLPFICTAYVWLLASAVSFYKGALQLWHWLKSLARAWRGEYAGTRHRSSYDVYHYKEDGALQWSDDAQAWLQPEDGLLRVGKVVLRDVRVLLAERSSAAVADGYLRGVLRYEAKTEAAWNGAYAHAWLQWWQGDAAVVCSMDMEDEQGLLPHDVMFKLMSDDCHLVMEPGAPPPLPSPPLTSPPSVLLCWCHACAGIPTRSGAHSRATLQCT